MPPVLATLSSAIFLLTSAFEPAQVLKIEAADRFFVAHGGQTKLLHLYGVDAPEPGQAYANDALKRVQELLEQRTVELEVRPSTEGGRSSGILRLAGGVLLHEVLLQEGLAWWDASRAPDERRLRDLSSQAMQQRAGLWQDPSPVAPWDFRRSQQKAAAQPPSNPDLEALEPLLEAAPAESDQRVTVTKEMVREAEQHDLLTLVARHQPRIVRDSAGKPVGVTASGIAEMPLASALGFREGDVITAVNGVQLFSELQILALVSQFEDTKNFQVGLQRGGKTKTLHITLP